MTYRQLIQFLMTLEPNRLEDEVVVSVWDSSGEENFYRVAHPFPVANEVGTPIEIRDDLGQVVPDGSIALSISVR
jgi:predicted DNA-binding transcriptional regulator YafY